MLKGPIPLLEGMQNESGTRLQIKHLETRQDTLRSAIAESEIPLNNCFTPLPAGFPPDEQQNTFL